MRLQRKTILKKQHDRYFYTYSIIYLHKNSCFPKFLHLLIKRQIIIHRLIQAMQFEPKLIFDCSYDSHLNKIESKNTGYQLSLCFALNRQHRNPFDLHLCNVDFNSNTIQSLEKYLPTLQTPSFPINLHEGNVTDVFPRDRLVYLTPHCNTPLTEYNPDDIYIIGAIVDKQPHGPLSMTKAKQMGIRMAKLPLDEHLSFRSGKALTLDQMNRIMLDIKDTDDWKHALRHVPRRKLQTADTDRKKFEKSLNKFNKNTNPNTKSDK